MKTLLMFVLLASTMCWFMFSPIYKHVFMVRQAVLQKEVDYMLEVGAAGSYGYIDGAMVAASRERLSAYGMDADRAEYEVSSSSGLTATNPAAPLLRGTGLILTIRYPYERLFEIDRLIGLTPPKVRTPG
ncbi:hypothetical protein [Paenibacillus sp. 1P07SE]|uniref:hypothetical protein n=1 Tax=Paenibacillus sp. 1P07SE TaxID=3132209 RepID=UPI0039A6DDBA